MTDRAREIAHRGLARTCEGGTFAMDVRGGRKEFTVDHCEQCDALTADIVRYGEEMLQRVIEAREDVEVAAARVDKALKRAIDG